MSNQKYNQPPKPPYKEESWVDSMKSSERLKKSWSTMDVLLEEDEPIEESVEQKANTAPVEKSKSVWRGVVIKSASAPSMSK